MKKGRSSDRPLPRFVHEADIFLMKQLLDYSPRRLPRADGTVARGALAKTLIDGFLNKGPHRVRWNGMNEAGDQVASGVYFYRITADKRSSTKKMLLLR